MGNVLPYDASKPTHCSACNRDLLVINPIYTIRGQKGAFCSRPCRATVTKETIPTQSTATEPAQAGAGKPDGKAATSPKAAKPATKVNRPSAGGHQKIFRTTAKPPSFREGSSRQQFFSLIKEGMTIDDLSKQAAAAGLDFNGNFGKFLHHYKVIELR